MRRILTVIAFALALCASAHAQTPISALPSATPASTDAVPFVTMGTTPKVTKKTTFADFFSLLQPSHVAAGNKQGNGSKFQLFTGSFSTNDCAKFDASGNLVTNGGSCAAAAPVQSVNGRTGAVVAAANDYNFNQLAGTATNAQLPSTLSSKTFDNTNTANFKGSLFTLQDATDTTKQARFDLSNIATSTTRTINVPNANSTTAQAASAVSHQFVTGMSAQGVFSQAQPATSDLSDYAEGTWTPVLNFGGATTGITYGTQIGRYVRIGNRVSVYLRIVLTSKGSATGAATITGLPFAASSTAGMFQIGTDGTVAGSYTGTPYFYIDPGLTTTINLGVNSNGVDGGALTNSNLTNASAINFRIWYSTN